jgi:uncharacterized protein (TIGR02646 family)
VRFIGKSGEPLTVMETRLATTTNLGTAAGARVAFDQIDKSAVRERLDTEQAGLCAFCMRRIGHDRVDDSGEPLMKIAHRTPIAVDPKQALAWMNLLGSCDGGQRSNGRHWTCDAAQESTALTVDPTTAGSVARLRLEYRVGRRGLFITSDDAPLRLDVEDTLNLNGGDLPELREQTWRAFQETHRRQHPRGPYGKPAWRKFLPTWLMSTGACAPEMAGAVEERLR